MDNLFFECINCMNDVKVGNLIFGGNLIWEVEESEYGLLGDLNFEIFL